MGKNLQCIITAPSLGAGSHAQDQPVSENMHQTGWRIHWDSWILGLFILVWLGVLVTFGLRLEIFSDELDIIQPARNCISGGGLYASVKYPSFSFYFFGFFFRVLGTLDSTQNCLRVARVVNYLVFVGNIMLMHAFLRRHFQKLWALVGAIIFSTLPVIVFSAMYVKTEGLLLLQLLSVLLVLGRISTCPNALRWHALAAACVGLSISTKLSPLPLALYAANAIYLRFHGIKIAPPAWLLFCGTLLLVVLASWMNLWIFPSVTASWKNDIYFLPGAGPFNAVVEGTFWGFPYGRFSSFITVTMPIALGLVGVFFLCSLVARSIPRWILWVFGGGNLASLIAGLSATRLRLPHGFTPHMIFFVVAGISFLAWLGSRKPADSLIVNSRLAWILVALSLSQTAWQAYELPGLLSTLSRLGQSVHKRADGDVIMLYNSISLKRLTAHPPFDRMRDPGSLREVVSLADSKPLYIFSAFVDNMCKYSAQPTYRDNCSFYYDELLSGKTTYRLERRDVIPWKGYLLIDPEFSHMSFLLFRRSSG